LGGIVVDGSIRVGGDKFESAILEYIRKKSNIAIGEGTAENIKIKIGSAIDDKKDKTINIRGRNLKSGLPEIITIGSREITDAIQEELEEIIKVIKSVLEKTPPELAADILDHGIVLTGGGALLKGLNQLITNKTGVPCFVSDYPLLSVAKGTGMVLDNLEKYKKALG